MCEPGRARGQDEPGARTSREPGRARGQDEPRDQRDQRDQRDRRDQQGRAATAAIFPPSGCGDRIYSLCYRVARSPICRGNGGHQHPGHGRSDQRRMKQKVGGTAEQGYVHRGPVHEGAPEDQNAGDIDITSLINFIELRPLK